MPESQLPRHSRPLLGLAMLLLAACGPETINEDPGVPPDPVQPLRTPVPTDVRSALLEALLCAEPDPMGILRELAADPALATSQGLTVRGNGLHGMQERIEVTLDPALVLPMGPGGAQVRTVTLAFEPPEPGFAALVYARVQGDPQAAIQALGLKPRASHAAAIADWVRPGGKDAGADADLECPDMVGLHVLAPDSYLLGCGWCSG